MELNSKRIVFLIVYNLFYDKCSILKYFFKVLVIPKKIITNVLRDVH